jgi:thiol:disulfide interchange protein DsbD
MTLRPFVAAALCLLSALSVPAARAAVSLEDLLPVDQAYRLVAHAVSRNRVEFTWTIAPGYYLYRHRFGVQPADSAFKFNPLQLPAGDKHHDEFFGDVETYRGSVTAVLTGATASDVDAVTFRVKFQGCADVGVCYPPTTRTVTVAMPPREGANADPVAGADPLAGLSGGRGANLLAPDEPLPEAEAFKVEAIAQSPAELLLRFTPAPGYYLYRDKTAARVLDAPGFALGPLRFPPGRDHQDEHFGKVVVFFDQVEVPVALQRGDAAARTLALEVDLQGCQDKGLCYPPMTRRLEVSLPAGAGASAAALDTPPVANPLQLGLLFALGLAVLAGLVLNLMPCVLPVLSFKALGLAQGGESHARARAHALWYTAGVLVSFAVIGAIVLAMRAAGLEVGIGFHLQDPRVVLALALLMFVVGLNFSGVFEVGGAITGVGQSLAARQGAIGDFFTGALAVVVASPCTTPFMGPALAYAFAAPPVAAIAVFLALGLGLALPFLLVGFLPSLAARLPKPGAWMDTLKHWLAFPMYATAVWLAWVFGGQKGVDGLGLLLLAMALLAPALWWFEHRRGQRGPGTLLVVALLVALAAGAAWFALKPAKVGHEPFSEARLAELRAEGRPVFVDMTADWCLTCKVNEKAVLHTDRFERLLAQTHTAYLVGDFTNQDAEIGRYLERFHSPGVPLYVVYPAGGGEGHQLPQLLGPALMEHELRTAAATAGP